MSSSLASDVMSIFELSAHDTNLILILTFNVSLTVYLAQIYFGLSVSGIGFWCLTSNSVALWACLLILISSSEVYDFDKETSSSTSHSWIPLNISFSSKFSRAESVFIAISSKIYKSLTLIPLFCSLMWTL